MCWMPLVKLYYYNKGVSTITWNKLIINWPETYDRIVFRKLVFKREGENLIKLNQYIKVVSQIEITRKKLLNFCIKTHHWVDKRQ
jgi:hypothetical protein